MFKPLSLKILHIFFLIFSNSGPNLFWKQHNEIWVKKDNPNFDVTMGSFELVGLYLLNVLKGQFTGKNIGLCRDDDSIQKIPTDWFLYTSRLHQNFWIHSNQFNYSHRENCVLLSSVQEFIEMVEIFLLKLSSNFYTFSCHILKSTDIWKM